MLPEPIQRMLFLKQQYDFSTGWSFKVYKENECLRYTFLSFILLFYVSLSNQISFGVIIISSSSKSDYSVGI